MSADYKAQFEAFFGAYDANNVGSVANLLTKHAGNEAAVARKLDEKYKCSFFACLEEVRSIYAKHAPEKAATAHLVLAKYPQREPQIVAKLKKEYNIGDGPSPAATASAPAPSAAPSGTTDYKAAITTFFTIYSPAKVAQVDALLTKHAGREADVCKSLDKSMQKNFFPTREKVAAIFQKHNPAQAANVDPLLIKQLGAGATCEQLIAALIKKYGDAEVGETTSASSPAAGGGGNNYVTRVRAMFTKYQPDKAAQAEAFVQKFAGREDEFIASLVRKYGPEPAADTPAASAPAAQAAPGIPKPPTEWEPRLTALLEKHDPAMAAKAGALLAKHAGREVDVWKKLVAKYGPEPYWTDRLGKLFKAHKPEMGEKVLGLLTQHAGQEEKLLQSLVQKLGPEPAAAAPPPSATAGTPAVNNMTPRAKVLRFYFYLSPDKLEGVLTQIGKGGKWENKEADVYAGLVKKNGSDPSPADPPGEGDYRARVVNIYTMYAEDKLAQVDAMIEKYSGREPALLASLISRYGEEPCKAAVPGGGGAAAPKPLTIKERIVALFKAHNPAGMAKIDGLLQKHAGQEEALLKALVGKLGPEPAPPVVQGGGAAAEPLTHKERVVRLFQKYQPEKVGEADAFLKKFEGREEDLIQALVKKLGPEPAPPTAGAPTFEERLTRMYETYNKEKLATVPALLQKFAGREEDLIAKLVETYGPEPASPDGGGTSRADQEAQDARDWADLPPALKLLHETQRTARWDISDEFDAEVAEMLDAEARHRKLAAKRPDLDALTLKHHTSLRKLYYLKFLRLLRERIRAEEQRHQALLDEKMTVYEQLQTNRFSMQYYDMLDRKRDTRKKQQNNRNRRVANKAPDQHSHAKDFIEYNVRMASVSPNRRQSSPRRRTPSPNHRIAMTPAVRDKVLNYQKKWLPPAFLPPDYPTVDHEGDPPRDASHSVASTKGGFSKKGLEARHRDRVHRAHVEGTVGTPEWGHGTLQSMTGAVHETGLERVMRERLNQEARRDVTEGQDAWDSFVEAAWKSPARGESRGGGAGGIPPSYSRSRTGTVSQGHAY